jgi:hypothetical protein
MESKYSTILKIYVDVVLRAFEKIAAMADGIGAWRFLMAVVSTSARAEIGHSCRARKKETPRVLRLQDVLYFLCSSDIFKTPSQWFGPGLGYSRAGTKVENQVMSRNLTFRQVSLILFSK